MNRYLSSFIIAFVLYTSALVTIFYFINQKSSCHAKCKCEKIHKINIAMISPVQTSVTQIKQEKKVEPKPKPVEKPKPKPKSKPIEKPKPKPKPIVKEIPKTIPVKKEEIKPPEPEPEPVVQEEVTEEFFETDEEVEDVTSETQEIIEELATQETTQQSSTVKAQEAQILQARQNLFLTSLIERINSNKSYPNMARRRCIEGIVDVTFVVMADGTVEDIEIISGRRIFKKSTIQAISRSFPMEVDTTLFNFPKEFKIKISYILR